MAVLYRSISRDFFSNADIAELTPLARLLYIGIWFEADREGRFVWHPKTLKLRYLALDDCNINDITDELIQSGVVVPYRVEDRVLAYIPGFAEFQNINNKEKASQLPAPPTDAKSTRSNRDTITTSTRPNRDESRSAVMECNGVECSGLPSHDNGFSTTSPLSDEGTRGAAEKLGNGGAA